ncbi:MAG: hypothetical protein HY452_02905 [Parcubacteria group bacterium]|nr:hypothetical protein [Parcubacteria group bacterium]
MKQVRLEVPFYTLFFGLIALGLYFGVVWLRSWAEPTPSFAIAAGVEPLVKIIDQEPYSDDVIIENRIYVNKVVLNQPGFVAVYENPYDKYGTLVGTSRFLPAGEHAYVSVDLVKKYQPGTRLYAVLHKDTGDAIYNLVQDPTLKDKRGLDILDDFRIRDGGFGHSK